MQDRIQKALNPAGCFSHENTEVLSGSTKYEFRVVGAVHPDQFMGNLAAEGFSVTDSILEPRVFTDDDGRPTAGGILSLFITTPPKPSGDKPWTNHRPMEQKFSAMKVSPVGSLCLLLDCIMVGMIAACIGVVVRPYTDVIGTSVCIGVVCLSGTIAVFYESRNPWYGGWSIRARFLASHAVCLVCGSPLLYEYIYTSCSLGEYGPSWLCAEKDAHGVAFSKSWENPASQLHSFVICNFIAGTMTAFFVLSATVFDLIGRGIDACCFRKQTSAAKPKTA